MTPIDTSTSKVASLTQTDAIQPDNNEHDDYTFYMDNSPRQDSKAVAKNSELAGDDDDEDGDDGEGATPTAFPNNNNNNNKSTSNSSLATVAESAIEKLVGIAMIVPDALITADNDNDIDEHDRDSCHRLDHAESEIYLEDNELVEKDHATTVRQQEQSAQPANQTDTALSVESLPSTTTTTAATTTAATPTATATAKDTTTMDESGDIPTSPATTSSSASSIISTETTSSSDTQTIGASKDILTEGQAFAYVGLCLVTSNALFQALEGTETAHAKQSLESFVSKLINRLYKHLDIDANSKFLMVYLFFVICIYVIFKERLVFFVNPCLAGRTRSLDPSIQVIITHIFTFFFLFC
jgi:hypothetical protein